MAQGRHETSGVAEAGTGTHRPTDSDVRHRAADHPRPQVGASRRPRGGFTADGLLAVATWLVSIPLSVLLVRWLDLDPFSVAGVVMPVAVGSVAGAVVLALVLRRPSDKLIGVAAGVYAGWIGLTLATSLHGTPFGFGSMTGDAGRFVAMATKYMSTSRSADAFVHDLPTEYPPLYPWIVGHTARLTDRPAWQLFGEMQIVVMSAAIVLAYVLWRRMVSAPVAFTIVGLSPAVFSEPSKDFEFISLLVFAPWILATFAGLRREQGGLHWLPAGLIGGLMVLTYQAWVLYASLGLLVLVVLTFRASDAKSRYLLHLLGVAATAFAVSSWYVIPFVTTLLTEGGNRISDLWLSSAIVAHPLVLPFLEMTPLGVIQLVGLLGMIWYLRTTFWAQPLLLLLLGTYAYRVIFLLKTVQDNHTGYLQYTERSIIMLLVTAGVLTAWEALPAALRRRSLPFSRVRVTAVTGIAVLVAWAALQGWESWVPGPRGLRNSVRAVGERNLATLAHAERLPDGRLPRFAPATYRTRYFPTSQVERVVKSQLGPDARPVVLSYDQRLFSFVPFYAYTPPNRLAANTLQRWDDRASELRKLAHITDPSAFAKASRNTKFGGIDVFVLRATDDGWRWDGMNFAPETFDKAHFHVEQLGGTVVAVRKG